MIKEKIENKRRAGSIKLDETQVMYDVVFIINVNSKGWILEKICRVIEKYSSLNCHYIFTERNDDITFEIPSSRSYFFAHYAMAYFAMSRHAKVFQSNIYVWFTHPDLSKGISLEELGQMLSACTRVFTPSTMNRELLQLVGVHPSKISVPLGGADPDDFVSTDRRGRTVGFVGAYYKRKSPDKMLAVIKALPDVDFILVGPRSEDVVNRGILWSACPQYGEMKALKNLRIEEVEYAEFAALYREMDVYLSLSELEGGPIPIIEAMMSNVIPVVTRTGFADDVIVQGQTGYVIDVDAPVEVVVSNIRCALDDTSTDVRTPALEFSWQKFGEQISSEMNPVFRTGERVEINHSSPWKTCLRHGWSSLDASGAWTKQYKATLYLSLSQATLEGQKVRLEFWPNAQELQSSILLSARVAGVESSSTIPAHGYSILDVDVPPAMDSLLVELEFSGRGHSADNPEEQAISMKLLSIELLPIMVADELSIQQPPEFQYPSAPAQEVDKRSSALKALSRLSLFGSSSDDTTATRDETMIATAAVSSDTDRVEFNFSERGDGKQYLRSGWHKPEKWGTWSCADTATLQFWLDSSGYHRFSKFVLVGKIYGALAEPSPSVKLAVLNGLHEAEVLFQFNTENDHTLEIDLSQWATPEDIWRISITRSKCFIPAELNASSYDQRSLGFFLKSCAFVA